MGSLSHLAKSLPQAFILYVSSNSTAQLLIESWILPESNTNLTMLSSLNHQGTCKSQMAMEARVTLFPYPGELLQCSWHTPTSLDNIMHRKSGITNWITPEKGKLPPVAKPCSWISPDNWWEGLMCVWPAVCPSFLCSCWITLSPPMAWRRVARAQQKGKAALGDGCTSDLSELLDNRS